MSNPELPPAGWHAFGGAWTEQKLELLRRYLRAYTTALKDKPNARTPFKLWYVDAFAGTGDRVDHTLKSTDAGMLFDSTDDAEAASFRKGSPRIAIETDPPFQRFLFIDRSRAHCDALEVLRKSLPAVSNRIEVRCADANDELARVCAEDWRDRRAVVFLDPYATSVRWSTLECMARTQAMDTWILFPLMAVNRLLKRDGDLPIKWKERIDDLLGTPDWMKRVYSMKVAPGLFGQPEAQVTKAHVLELGRFFLERLRGIFAGVSKEPKLLSNSSGSPLFMLCFAAANPKGAPIAIRIADHLLAKDVT